MLKITGMTTDFIVLYVKCDFVSVHYCAVVLILLGDTVGTFNIVTCGAAAYILELPRPPILLIDNIVLLLRANALCGKFSILLV